jgi:hypothetical protein
MSWFFLSLKQYTQLTTFQISKQSANNQNRNVPAMASSCKMEQSASELSTQVFRDKSECK